MRENFRDDAFWGILAKTVELTTFYISDTSFALLDIKISTEGNGLCSSVYYKRLLTMQKLSFHSKRRENIGIQEIH